MAMQVAEVTVKGIRPLLQNNPQTVDRFNQFARRMKAINDKKTRRTDDDYLELRDLEVASKVYFDEDVGVYVPSTWLIEGLGGSSHTVAKLAKAKVRGAVFATESKLALSYDHSDKVKAASDVIGNPIFRHTIGLPQGQVRVTKAFPIFHGWQFKATLEFDDSIIDIGMLKRIAEYAGKYVGFGDLRPTFGRAEVEVTQ